MYGLPGDNCFKLIISNSSRYLKMRFALEGRRRIASDKFLGSINMADSMLADGNSD